MIMKLINIRYRRFFIIGLVFLAFLYIEVNLVKAEESKYSPYVIVFDLGSNGIKIKDMAKPFIYFDFNNDNFAERTDWITKEDGFLCIDRNNNKEIDNITELFSINSASKLELRELDSNNDGIVDEKDIQYTNLKVWQDINEDGYTQEGELKSLDEAGIKSFTLSIKNKSGKNIENLFIKALDFIIKDDLIHKDRIKFIKFHINRTYTKYNHDYEINVGAIGLPWIRGYGRMLDLPLAMTKNEKLKLKVEELSKIKDSKQLYDKIDELLECWTNSEEIPDSSMNGSLKTKQVRILSEFTGREPFYVPKDKKLYAEEAYLTIKNKVYVDFLAQTYIGEKFDITHDFGNDLISVGSNTYEKLVTNLTDEDLYFASYLIADSLQVSEILDTSKLKVQINKVGYGIELIRYLNCDYLLKGSGKNEYVKLLTPLVKSK